jgi:hypothetical protein
MSKVNQWLTPQKLNKNLVLEIIYLLLNDNKKDTKPIKIDVSQEVKIKEDNIFDNLKENNATKFLPKKTD